MWIGQVTSEQGDHGGVAEPELEDLLEACLDQQRVLLLEQMPLPFPDLVLIAL